MNNNHFLTRNTQRSLKGPKVNFTPQQLGDHLVEGKWRGDVGYRRGLPAPCKLSVWSLKH